MDFWNAPGGLVPKMPSTKTQGLPTIAVLGYVAAAAVIVYAWRGVTGVSGAALPRDSDGAARADPSCCAASTAAWPMHHPLGLLRGAGPGLHAQPRHPASGARYGAVTQAAYTSRMSRRVAVPRWPDVQLEWLHNYHDRLHDAGLEGVDVTDVSPGLRDCDGLLLTGGVDVDPTLYSELPHAMTQTPVPARDTMELTLLRQALASDLPVLAICRGLQLLNVCSAARCCSILTAVRTRPARLVHPGMRCRLSGDELYGVLGATRARQLEAPSGGDAGIVSARIWIAAMSDRLVERRACRGAGWSAFSGTRAAEDEAPAFI